MAVEAKQKRKRKREEEAVDDGLEFIPKKVSKQQKATNEEQPNNIVETQIVEDEIATCSQKQSEKEMPESNVSPADSGYEEKSMKFSMDFKMLDFRMKLRGTNFITELRHFLYLCEVKPKTVAKYIEKRGKPLEIAEALERVEKSNILHNAYLCEALQRVVMEIVTNQTNHMESAMHVCRYFLKAHINVVDLLLNSPQLRHRRVALKLLTAFVCVDSQLGRQILSSFDILSNVKTIENLLSHSQQEIHESDSVRKCYVHFVLAYLVEGNTLLVRNILDRSSLLRALISGMCFDDHVTVCVVLNTIRKYVLESADISKTKKIHVFDLESCKKIARLYDWKGPNGFVNQNSKIKWQSQSKVAVDQGEAEAVATATHEFLLVLLTSRKHGIVFDAITHYRQRHNPIHGKLIGSLYKPWCNPLKTELILKVLTACPEIGRTTIKHFAGVINPAVTQERVEAIKFLASLIGILHPKLLEPAFEKLTLTDFSLWIKDVCLPTETLLFLTQSNYFQHSKRDHRLAAMQLLLAMFTQYVNFMQALQKERQKDQATGSSQLRRFKFDILNHLLVHFPTVETILSSLHTTINEFDTRSTESAKDMVEQLETTLDLLLVICKQNRSFINQTSQILDFIDMLRPFYAQNENEDDDDDDDEADDDEMEEGHKIAQKRKKSIRNAAGAFADIKLELKAIKTILVLQPNALHPSAELFRNVLKSFLKAFVYDSDEVRNEAGTLLRTIFRNTGLFDSNELEIDLWLEALRFFDRETVDIVTQVFLEVFQVTTAEVEMPESASAGSNAKIANLQGLFENIENGLSVQGFVEDFNVSKLMPLIFKGVEIIEPLNLYLETVCLLMFHYYSKPEYIQKIYEMQFECQADYMNSWLSEAGKNAMDAIRKNEIAKNIPFLINVQNAIVKPASGSMQDQEFENLFGTRDAKHCLELEICGKTVKLSTMLKNPRLVFIYIQQILFITTELVGNKTLTAEQAETASVLIINLMDLLQKLEASAELNIYSDLFSQSHFEEGHDELISEKTTFLSSVLKYVYGARLNHVRSDLLFNVDSEAHLNYLNFLHALTQHCTQIPAFAMHTKTYRLKIVKAVAISVQDVESTKAQSSKLLPAIRLIEAFQLDAENCTEILEILCSNLKYSDFFVADGDRCQRTFFFELVTCVLRRLVDLQQYVPDMSGSVLKRLVKFYSQFINKLNGDLNLESFEMGLHDFLSVAHQYITHLDTKLFESMFVERKLTKASIKLAVLLLERDPKLEEIFVGKLAVNVGKKELFYPLLKVVIKKNLALEQKTWSLLYQEFRSGFMKTIEKPQKAAIIYKENMECSRALIEHCMPITECIDFCKKNLKFNDASELYQVHLIRTIYKKAWSSPDLNEEQRSKISTNFIDLQIQMLLNDLKRQALNSEKAEVFAYFLFDWFELTSQHVKCDYGKVLGSQYWLNFCKQALKVGMQHQQTADIHTENFNGFLLKVLAFLCDKLYVDHSESIRTESTAANEPEEPAQLFGMICTHSRFYDVVLSLHSTPVKTQILNLLWTLGKKSPNKALTQLEIPALLGAYQAKLTDADRYALALLQLYELHDTAGLQKYRPFIWGESAVAFYALRSEDMDERSRLTQQETSVEQVMSLIDRQCCEYTIENFPIWRKLNAGQQVVRVEFTDQEAKALHCLGSNNLERKIESEYMRGAEFENITFSNEDLRLCPTRSSTFEQCYDPSFFVPLMSMCFAPEWYAHAARPVQNGLLSLCFAALSSQDKEMRQASGIVQMRYRTHFEQGKFFERPLWIQAYENIQAGLSELCASWSEKHTKASKQYVTTPRVPYISGLFVAQTFNLTTDPTNLLYKQLTMYLRLKSTFNFQCVPEFNLLFYSTEVEHHSFRQFIVQVIKNGIKSSSDLFLLVSTNTFKVLMGFYGSPASNLETNLLILSVFSICVKIPASSKIMIEHVGIVSWLRTVICSVEFYQFDVIEGIISIISNLWYALTASKADFHNYNYICLELHHLVLSLLPHLSARITVNNFARLLNVLQKTAAIVSQAKLASAQVYKAMSSEQLDHLIDCAQKHFGASHLRYIEKLKLLGGAGSPDQHSYCNHLLSENLESAAIMSLLSLQGYTLRWWQECRNGSIDLNNSNVSNN